MTLEDLGYNVTLENYRKEENLLSFEVGRVIAEHKERYIVSNAKDEFDAEVIGKLLFKPPISLRSFCKDVLFIVTVFFHFFTYTLYKLCYILKAKFIK